MSGRTVVLGVITILLAGAIWTLSTRKPKGERSNFREWAPSK